MANAYPPKLFDWHSAARFLNGNAAVVTADAGLYYAPLTSSSAMAKPDAQKFTSLGCIFHNGDAFYPEMTIKGDDNFFPYMLVHLDHNPVGYKPLLVTCWIFQGGTTEMLGWAPNTVWPKTALDILGKYGKQYKLLELVYER